MRKELSGQNRYDTLGQKTRRKIYTHTIQFTDFDQSTQTFFIQAINTVIGGAR